MPKVTVNGQVFNFPDTMSQEEMGAAIQLRLKQQPPTLSNSEPVVENPVVNTGDPNASRVGFAIDQMQNMAGKGVEAFGRATGFEGVENYGTSVVEKNKQQIEDRNYQSTMPGSFLDQDGAKDKFLWTTEKIIENAGTAAVGLGGAAASALAAFFGAPIAVTAGITGLAVGSSALLGTGEVAGEIEEKTGSYDPKLALGGGFIIGLLDRLGATRLIPTDQLMKMTGKEIVDELVKRGAGGMAAEFTTQVVKKAGAEGLTEVGQEAISMGASAYSGGDYTAGEVGNRLVDAAAIGTGQGGAVSTVIDGSTAVRSIFKAPGVFEDMREMSDGQRRAAGDVARDLEAVAKAEGFNLKKLNTNSEKGAKPALEKVYRRNSKLIKNLAKALKDRLKTTNATSLQELIDVYSVADGAIDDGKNKVSGYVSSSDLKAIQKLVGGTQEGAELMNALRKSNVITDLFKDGMKGGVSQFTDYFSPLGTTGAVYDASRLGNLVIGGALGTSAAVATGGTSLIPQGGVVVLGRLIDATTGRRAKLDRFVKKNRKAPGLPAPEGLSVLEQAQEETNRVAELDADAKVRKIALAKISTQLNAPEKADSPVGSILLGTGLDRDGLSEIITDMSEIYVNEPEITAVLESIQQNMAGDTNAVLDLNEIIPIIGTIAATTKPNLVVRAPDNPLIADLLNSGAAPNVSTAAPGPLQGGNVATTPENYQAGKEANQQAARDLADGVVADTTIEQDQKELIFGALQIPANETVSIMDLRLKAGELELQGVSKENINKYFQPYIERMERQTKRRTVLQKAQDTQPQAEPFLIDQAMPRQNPIENRAEDIPTPPQMTPAPVQNPGASLEGPVLQPYVNPLGLPQSDIDTTNIDIMPSQSDVNAMKEGTYKPAKKRTLVQFAQMLNDRWQSVTGRTAPFKNTPENVDKIANLMATEAANALQKDSTAIGWYDRKLKAAKAVVALVDPRVTQSSDAEAAFDFALAVTSNGQAVADNFKYALEVFQEFMNTGLMPTDTWIKGGERNEGMIKAFSFFNAYNASGANLPIQEFLDTDFMVNELTAYIASFNGRNGTEISVPSSEAATETVKGSYIIGPKIGQGFYQNIRGNYDPLTMDIWWMRMWNRLTGRPFEDVKDLPVNRAKIREELKVADDLGKRLIKETLKDMGIKRSALKDDGTLDTFVSRLDRRYQSFYRKFQKENKKAKPPKPQLFKSTGTMVKNMVPQLQGQPKNAGERKYMRIVTAAAIAKLKENGIDISTADFQALMWYPEKQLFRQGGVAPGRGADNDYLDAAKILAEERGISNEQIEQALSTPDGSGSINSVSSTLGQDGRLSTGPNRSSNPEESAKPILNAGPDIESRTSTRGTTARPTFSNRVAIPEIKQAATLAKTAMIGKTGSPEQDGIQSVEQAIAFANGLGMTVRLFNTQKELVDQYKQFNPEGTAPASTRAFLARTGKKGAEGSVFGLNPGAIQDTGSAVTNLDALVSVIHEVSHAITLGPMDGVSAQNTDATFTNPITGEPDVAPPGSFVYSALRPLLEGKGDPDIMAEIDNIQQNVEVFTTKDPKQRSALRSLKEALNKQRQWQRVLENEQRLGIMSPEQAKSDMDSVNAKVAKYTNYVQQAREIAVDPMIIYILNPALAKKIMPKTAALISSEFKKAKNPSIQFFNHPLAMVVATVMAMLAKGLGEDEEKKKQMQMAMSGALSNQPPPPGILSAA